jgi:hypothetical protein
MQTRNLTQLTRTSVADALNGSMTAQELLLHAGQKEAHGVAVFSQCHKSGIARRERRMYSNGKGGLKKSDRPRSRGDQLPSGSNDKQHCSGTA